MFNAVLNVIRGVLGKPLCGKDPSYRGGWYWYIASAPKGSNIAWRITTDGKLRFGGRDLTPSIPVTLEYLERIIRNMREKISASGHHDMVVEGIYIEEFVACGLWDTGFIQREDLERAENFNDGIMFLKEILGETYQITIQGGTYYDSYDVIVRNHPEGLIRVRDTPDLLAVLAKEATF